MPGSPTVVRASGALISLYSAVLLCCTPLQRFASSCFNACVTNLFHCANYGCLPEDGVETICSHIGVTTMSSGNRTAKCCVRYLRRRGGDWGDTCYTHSALLLRLDEANRFTLRVQPSE